MGETRDPAPGEPWRGFVWIAGGFAVGAMLGFWGVVLSGDLGRSGPTFTDAVDTFAAAVGLGLGLGIVGGFVGASIARGRRRQADWE